MTLTGNLREAMKASGQSRYAISMATGIQESQLSRFAAGADLRGSTMDKLAAHLGLELVRINKRKGN